MNTGNCFWPKSPDLEGFSGLGAKYYHQNLKFEVTRRAIGSKASEGNRFQREAGPFSISKYIDMAQGTIKKIISDKGFGFITGDGGKDLFFHQSVVEGGASFDDLHEGQNVEYTEGQGPKGPRAENVRPV